MMRHIWIFVLSAVLMTAARAEPKAGDACNDKDAYAIGANGELLECVYEQPKWRKSNLKDCQINAAEVIDGAKSKYSDVQGSELRVSVPLNICLETSRFKNFVIGDTNNWRVDVVARDENHVALAYKIRELYT